MKKIISSLACIFFAGGTVHVSAMLPSNQTLNALHSLIQKMKIVALQINSTHDRNSVESPPNLNLIMKPVIHQQQTIKDSEPLLLIPLINVDFFNEYAIKALNFYEKKQKKDQNAETNHTENIKLLASACSDLLSFDTLMPTEIKHEIMIIKAFSDCYCYCKNEEFYRRTDNTPFQTYGGKKSCQLFASCCCCQNIDDK